MCGRRNRPKVALPKVNHTWGNLGSWVGRCSADEAITYTSRYGGGSLVGAWLHNMNHFSGSLNGPDNCLHKAISSNLQVRRKRLTSYSYDNSQRVQFAASFTYHFLDPLFRSTRRRRGARSYCAALVPDNAKICKSLEFHRKIYISWDGCISRAPTALALREIITRPPGETKYMN